MLETAPGSALVGRHTAGLFRRCTCAEVLLHNTNYNLCLDGEWQQKWAGRVAQATLVASWLTELLLDQINRALLEEGARPASPAANGKPAAATAQQLSAQLQSFLSSHLEVWSRRSVLAGPSRRPDYGSIAKPAACVSNQILSVAVTGRNVRRQVLDPGLTTALLAGYGRLDDLVHYATLRQARSFSLLMVMLPGT